MTLFLDLSKSKIITDKRLRKIKSKAYLLSYKFSTYTQL